MLSWIIESSVLSEEMSIFPGLELVIEIFFAGVVAPMLIPITGSATLDVLFVLTVKLFVVRDPFVVSM